MVQIIDENKKQSTSQMFGKAFANLGQAAGQAIPQYFKEMHQKDLLEKENKLLEKEGLFLQGLSPETRRQMIESKLKGDVEERKQAAKYSEQLKMVGKLGIKTPFSDEGNSVPAEDSYNVKPEVKKSTELNKPLKKQSKEFSDFSDDDLVKMAVIPALEKSVGHELDIRKRNAENIKASYDFQKPFIDKTTSEYQNYETQMKPRLQQMQKMATDEELISPGAAQFLEVMGIPLGLLENPSNELYDKVSQDLLKGLPDTYGARILKVEVDNFLKTIPRLINSAEGRRMIASNMLKLGEMKEVFYKEMRRQQSGLIDKDEKFPVDFEQRVFDNVLPQVDRINKEFVKLSEIKSVPPGTIPYFNPQGEVSFVPKNPEAIKWAEENGGKRIW